MKIEEYKRINKDIEDDCAERMRVNARRYAKANNPVSAGDVLRDHYPSIRVVKQSVYYASPSGLPGFRYSGTRLKKSGEEFKSGEQADIYQCNIKSINGVTHEQR